MADGPTGQPRLPLDPVVERAMQQLAELARDGFMSAADPAAYLLARDHARVVAQEAQQRGAAGPAAIALVTAAECSWFAASEASPGSPDPALVGQALLDCTHAAPSVRAAPTDGLLAVWSSVSGSVLEAVAALRLCPPGSFDARVVTRLVAQLHLLVPPDVLFGAEWGGPPRVVDLATAMVAAWRSVDEAVPDWLARRVSVSIEAPRRAASSRLGRLVASAAADCAAAEVLADTLAGPRDALDVAHLFELVEASSARTLLDGVAGLGAAPVSDPVSLTLQREATAYSPWRDADPTIRQLLLLSVLPLGGTPMAAARSRELISQLEERTARSGQGYRGVALLPSLVDVQALLAPHQALVRYIVPTGRGGPGGACHVLVVTSEGADLIPLPVRGVAGASGSLVVDDKAPLDLSPLPFAIAEARTALKTPLTDEGVQERFKRLAQLHDLLVAPVLASGLAGPTNEWVIVPSRTLHGVPWMALHDHTGRWLVDDAAVTIAPSAAVWMHLLGRGPRPSGHLTSLGDPLVAHQGYPRLRGTRDEVDALAQAWRNSGLRTTPLVDRHATWAALNAAAPGAGLVHVGTHGSFPDEAALFGQGFFLSPAPGHDGVVTADDLRRLPLDDAWCVLLTLCSGGAYRVGPGDEPYGLVPALLEAGATTVLAPQWEVDDATAAALVADLAPHLLDLGPAQALRQAVLAQRAAHDGIPGDYCAFLAIGTGLGPAAAGEPG